MQLLQSRSRGDYTHRLQSRPRGDNESVFRNETYQNHYALPCTTNDWKQVVSPKKVFQAKDRDSKAFQANGSRTPIGRRELYRLQMGDQIGWRRSYPIWHHAIVVETDAMKKQIKVIHFTKDGRQIVVKEEWIPEYDMLRDDLFRFDHPKYVCNENPPERVLERARSLLGRKGYNIITNNCEHVATYCKTGKADCVQVRWWGGKVKETLHTGIANTARYGSRIGSAVAKEASNQTVRSIGNQAAKVGAANMFRSGLLVGIETAHCAYDIYQFNKKRREGHMTRSDFKKSTTERVSGGVVGAGFAVAGSYVGGALGGVIGSCIPIVGTSIGSAVGSFVGGFVGSFVGKITGTVFGRWLGKCFF